jgi:hypothetical protein
MEAPSNSVVEYLGQCYDWLKLSFSKLWPILLAPLLGLALKFAMEIRARRRIKPLEAIISTGIGMFMGIFSGLITFGHFQSDDENVAARYAISVAVVMGLLGEKMVIYFYENLPSILDSVIAYLTGGKHPKGRR